jgi:N-methylhydantoinase A
LEISECTIEGRQVDVPSLDIMAISAGGGTIARVDRGGFLVVGPESAGAVPGPACFGRGGTLPTITDAYIVCGILSEDSFLGGSQKIDAAASYRAIETHLAKPLGISVLGAAAGILRIVNARIADEIRLQAAKKGIELSEFTLAAFGGAGPVHAAAVAEELGITNFLVPFSPGAFSALGLLCSDIIHDFLRSDLTELGLLTPAFIDKRFDELRAEAARALTAESLDVNRCEFVRELDMRYAGQGYELRLGIDSAMRGGVLDMDSLREAFHVLHESQHGHSARDGVVEVVSYRLRAKINTPKVNMQSKAQAPASGNEMPEAKREVRFGSAESILTPVFRRADLMRAGARSGPAVVVQFDATTVIPRGWTARADETGNVIVERSAA